MQMEVVKEEHVLGLGPLGGTKDSSSKTGARTGELGFLGSE